MAIAGSSCHIIGTILILLGAGIWYVTEYRRQIWFSSLLWFLEHFSLLCSFLVFARASQSENSVAFWLIAPGVGFHVLGHAMLYATSSAMGVKNIAYTFIFNLMCALSLFEALLFQLGEWTMAGTPIAASYKSVMWVSVGCSFGNMLLLLLARIFSNGSLNVKTMAKLPFLRSLVLMCLLANAALAGFKFTIYLMALSTETMSFGAPSVMLAYLCFFKAFTPGEGFKYPPKPASAEGDAEYEAITEDYDEAPEDDEDYEEAAAEEAGEEEAAAGIEARFRGASRRF